METGMGGRGHTVTRKERGSRKRPLCMSTGFTDSKNHNPTTPVGSVRHLRLRGKSDLRWPSCLHLEKGEPGRVLVKVKLAEGKTTSLPKPVLDCSN